MNTAEDRKPAEVDLGRRLAELRAEFGWSQSELARRSGVSRATVARIEGGEVDPLRSVRALAGTLGLAIGELLAVEIELHPGEVDRLTLAADLRDLAARSGRLVIVRDPG
jgi:transcriptional regulator with XRE-family HTH domain